MGSRRTASRRGAPLRFAAALTASVAIVALSGAAAATRASGAGDSPLDHALHSIVRSPNGPPGVAVVVQRGDHVSLHRAGAGNLAGGTPIRAHDAMRLASVAKAFSGAVALALVAHGELSLDDTVGSWLPRLSKAWSSVTLAELLQHRSGIPDFSKSEAFVQAVRNAPQDPPPPRVLLSYAAPKLNFPPGTRYEYSNSDNVVAALMAQAATGKTYERALRRYVLGPLGLASTSLPRGAALPAPFIHGYDIAPPGPPEDVTSVIAAGWAWASGGVVSTPHDANRFVRAYVRGATTDRRTRKAQFTFGPGSSEPPGPGRNSAGMALFRYQTRCGTVYGHTGNTLGYTQFVAASRNGRNSVVVTANAQIVPATHPRVFTELRHIYTLAVCSAMHR